MAGFANAPAASARDAGTVHVVTILKKMMAAIAVGFSVIFAPKATEQHWSETTSALVDEARAEGESSED